MDQLTPVVGRRRGSAWIRVSHGLHRPASDDRLETTLAAWQLVLPPSARFTHLTAASVYGWWLPPLPDLPVLAAIDERESRPRRSGIVCTRHDQLVPPVLRNGLRLDPPAEALLASARHLGLLDLVVLIDGALHSGSCTRQQLDAVAGQRRRGVPLFRRALSLADGRSESAWETLLRLLHVMCGIAVVPQHRLLDAQGRLVARGDLWLAGTNALHEYDGEHHLLRRQQRKDLARAREISNLAWVRRGYTSSEVLNQALTILRDADQSLGREHRPDRIRVWNRLVAESLFTPAGRRRLRRRLPV